MKDEKKDVKSVSLSEAKKPEAKAVKHEAKKERDPDLDIGRERNDLLYYVPEMLPFLTDHKRVPTQMQHCMLKVFPKMEGDPKQKYVAAFNICAAVFEKNGYQKSGLRLTGKGFRNNRRHQREEEVGYKREKFGALTERLWKNTLKRNKVK